MNIFCFITINKVYGGIAIQLKLYIKIYLVYSIFKIDIIYYNNNKYNFLIIISYMIYREFRRNNIK